MNWQDLQREVEAHIEEKALDLIDAGVPEREAWERARREFGNRTLTVEASREVWGWRWLEELGRDLRFALRDLRKAPGFAAVAILTLGLGIGANIAVFSFVEAVMLRPLDYPDSERLVAVWETITGEEPKTLSTSGPGGPGRRMSVAPANLMRYQAASGSFTGIAGYAQTGLNLTGSGTPERILGEQVTASYFGVLGVQPSRGRAFLPEEDRPGGARVLVVMHDFWQNRFGGDPGLLGAFLTLNGERYQVVGIMPPGFQPLTQLGRPEPVSFLMPAAYPAELLANHGDHEVGAVARLRPGVPVRLGQLELDGISARLAAEFPDSNRNVTTRVESLKEDVTRNVRLSLLVLLGAVGLMLLIAGTNLASLLMVRATNRRHEIAMRIALGASRGRIFRELATHSVLLAVLGGAAGLAIAAGAKQLMLAVAPDDIPRLANAALNWPVVLFGAVLALGTGLFVSVLPGWQASKAGALGFLRTSPRSSAGRATMRWRSVLVVVQVALCMVLLVGAGLMLRSFVSLQAVELGFATERVLAMNVNLPELRYPDAARRLRFFEELEAKVGSVPGVEAAAFANRMPLRGGWSGGFQLDTGATAPETLEADMQAVSPGYFSALGMGLLRGRGLTADDGTGMPPAVVVNSEFARRFLGGADPVGKRMRRSASMPWITIVGLVTDVRRYGKSEPVTPQVYYPAAQTELYPVRLADFVFRSRANPRELLPAVQEAVWSIDSGLPVTNVRTLEEIVSMSAARRRFQTLLLLVLAGLALTLAAIGIYGVISYDVTRRTAEIGIRMALGASQGTILRSVVGRSMLTVTAGVGLGAVGALGLSRYLQSLLFAISPSDPFTYASLILFLCGVGLAAGILPAVRAARLDPTVALRAE